MAYNEIFPSECLGDSLWKINENAKDFDTRLVTLSGRTPRRAFGDGDTFEIWIDSGFAGNDDTADGTAGKPFKTIAAATRYYSKYVATRGGSARFRLVPGTSGNPRVYKGAGIYFGHDGVTGGGGGKRMNDVPTVASPHDLPGGVHGAVDRTIYFIGDELNPDRVVIEPYFLYSRGKGLDFWQSYNLLIDYPNGSVIVNGITFRYNAIGNLPAYTGGDQFYMEKTDYAYLILFQHLHYARVDKCRFELFMNPNTQSSIQSGWVGPVGSLTQPTAKYTACIAYHRTRFGRIGNITIAGGSPDHTAIRYIVKCSGSRLEFEPTGQITLFNNPRFFGLFEVEGGSTFNISTIWQGGNVDEKNESYIDTNYTLRFSGSCGAPIPDRQWYNYTIVGFESRWSYAAPGITFNEVQCPSQGATPAMNWPPNVTRRLLWVDQLGTSTGTSNNVFYNYLDTGRTPGTGNPRNV